MRSSARDHCTSRTQTVVQVRDGCSQCCIRHRTVQAMSRKNTRKHGESTNLVVVRFLNVYQRPGRRTTMLTDTKLLANAESLRGSIAASPAATTQKVAIINGNPEILALVENVLSAGHYD